MLKISFPAALALNLLLPPGHAEAHASFETGRPAHGEVVRAEIAASGQDPHELAHVAPLTVLAQADKGHGHSNMATPPAGDLVIDTPWARESVTRTSAVYLTVRNNGDQHDRLIGVASDVADKVELHSSVMQDGVMKMRPVEAVDVPAHGEASLAPGGLHVMLMGLKAPLEEGGSFSLILEFERTGKVEVTTKIEDIAHAGSSGHSH